LFGPGQDKFLWQHTQWQS